MYGDRQHCALSPFGRPASLEGYDACAQADVRISLPRALSTGVARTVAQWDPDLHGGVGGYAEAEPVLVHNVPDLDVRVVARDPRSWMQRRRGDVHVTLDANVAFGNITLHSNMGPVRLEQARQPLPHPTPPKVLALGGESARTWGC